MQALKIFERPSGCNLVEVAPGFAESLLKRNSGGRPLSKALVHRLTREMIEGTWNETQPIKFSRDGCLLDGRHRLQAVVNSKTTQVLWILTGSEVGIFDKPFAPLSRVI